MDIVIVDDELKMGQIIKRALARAGHDAASTTDPREAIGWVRDHPVRLVLCDLRMPVMDGLQVLEEVKALRPEIGFIVMTAYASAESAVEAMKKGAYDYLIKPFATEELRTLVDRCLETRQLKEENESLRAMVDERCSFDNIVSASRQMDDVLRAVEKVSRSDVSVLLRGESGTGKEILARAIHVSGARRDKPFVKVNCGALPDNLLESELFGHVAGAFTGAVQTRTGLFDEADGGAIFLDEIGDISPALQVRLLRVLQEGEFQRVGESQTRKVDVRIIAATHRDLEEAMEEGTFREDLYYRLNVVPIFIPPLRERPEDIRALIDHFLPRFSGDGRRFSLTPEAYTALVEYPWPGNVRELENAVEHATVMADGDEIGTDDLPVALRQHAAGERRRGAGVGVGEMTLGEIEKQALSDAMARAGGNHTRAAQLLGITRRTLGYRLRKHGLKDQPGGANGGNGANGEPAAPANPSEGETP